MPDHSADLKKFLNSLEPGGPPSNCVVLIRNDTTPDREATIIAAGCHFFYEDDAASPTGDYLAGPVRLELGAGDQVPFRSSDPRRRVAHLAIGVKVRFGEKGSLAAKEYTFFNVIEPPDRLLANGTHVRSFLIETRVDFCAKNSVVFNQLMDASYWYTLLQRSSDR